jgi:hypothetical protein
LPAKLILFFVFPNQIALFLFAFNIVIFDMYQQNGCVRTQIYVNICVEAKIAVPLHRQKKKTGMITRWITNV